MINRRLKIKVCGMRDPDNIRELSALDIDYMGFVFYKKSPRLADAVPAVDLPSGIKRTGVFVNEREPAIRDRIGEGLQAVQLHGSESPEFCQAFRKTGVEVIKAFGIRDGFDRRIISCSTRPVRGTAEPERRSTGRCSAIIRWKNRTS